MQSPMTCASSSGENSTFPEFDWKLVYYFDNTFIQNQGTIQTWSFKNALLDVRNTVEAELESLELCRSVYNLDIRIST